MAERETMAEIKEQPHQTDAEEGLSRPNQEADPRRTSTTAPREEDQVHIGEKEVAAAQAG